MKQNVAATTGTELLIDGGVIAAMFVGKIQLSA